MQQIKIQAEVAAPVEAVWSVYTDHVGWARWAGPQEVVLRQKGDPPPNGLGAIRVIRARGIAVEEEITAFEPPKRMVYRLVGGIPVVRDHEGEVVFEPFGENTRVVWRVRFRPLIPGTGWLLETVLRPQLQSILDRLVTYPFESGR